MSTCQLHNRSYILLSFVGRYYVDVSYYDKMCKEAEIQTWN